MTMQLLLAVEALNKYFALRRSLVDGMMGKPHRRVQAAKEVGFAIARGKSFGLAGAFGAAEATRRG